MGTQIHREKWSEVEMVREMEVWNIRASERQFDVLKMDSVLRIQEPALGTLDALLSAASDFVTLFEEEVMELGMDARLELASDVHHCPV